jgi:hypothetical protein
MRHVPWITLVATAIIFVSWFGQDLLRQAFISGEQLANSIAQFMLLVILGIIIALALLEWGVKFTPPAPGKRMMYCRRGSLDHADIDKDIWSRPASMRARAGGGLGFKSIVAPGIRRKTAIGTGR